MLIQSLKQAGRPPGPLMGPGSAIKRVRNRILNGFLLSARLAAILAFFSLAVAASPLGAQPENEMPLHLGAPAVTVLPGGGLYLQSLCSVYQQRPGLGAGLECRGDFQALFLDQWGQIREDTNGNQVLDQASGQAASHESQAQGDLLIRRIKDGDGKAIIQKGRYEKGRNEGLSWENAAPDEPIKPLWSLGEMLAAFTDEQIILSRAYSQAVSRAGEGLSGGRRLYTVFTPEPPPGGDEPIQHPGLGLLNAEAAAALKPQMGPVGRESGAEAAELINYMLGLRNSAPSKPQGPENESWRLGAVNEARAVIVDVPSARHHLLYGDLSYLDFQKEQAGRRQMAYFGSGDGLFHAVNLGFYQTFTNGGGAFRKKPPDSQATAHELGAEIWGFLPPALLPGLRQLAKAKGEGGLNVEYLQPLVADIKIDSDKGRWWRTVLIGGLRIEDKEGGAKLLPGQAGEFFAFDVTDPEKEPLLLWTFRHDDLGPAQTTPAVVCNQGRWYVLIAGGPVGGRKSGETKGSKIFVLEASSGRLVRTIDNDSPGAISGAFTSVAPDYLVNQTDGPEAAWTTPLVYFSQGEIDLSKGAVRRLTMIGHSSGGQAPQPLPPAQWRLEYLCRTASPLIYAVNSAMDYKGNRWVFFTTAESAPAGFAPDLKYEKSSGYLYGVKESLDENAFLAFKEVNDEKLLDLSGIKVFDNGELKGAPAGIKTFDDLRYLLGQSGDQAYEGYKRPIEFSGPGLGAALRPAGGLGQPKIDLLGNQASLIAFTSYAPGDGQKENIMAGQSRLNLADAFTGLPAPYFKPLAGQMEKGEKITVLGQKTQEISGFIDSGPGRASETIIVKTERGGTIIKNISPEGRDNSIIISPSLSYQSGLISWREVKDMGLQLKPEDLAAGLEVLN